MSAHLVPVDITEFVESMKACLDEFEDTYEFSEAPKAIEGYSKRERVWLTLFVDWLKREAKA